ncbi:unnamed protein product, partial [Prorocentrum cordatum]
SVALLPVRVADGFLGLRAGPLEALPGGAPAANARAAPGPSPWQPPRSPIRCRPGSGTRRAQELETGETDDEDSRRDTEGGGDENESKGAARQELVAATSSGTARGAARRERGALRGQAGKLGAAGRKSQGAARRAEEAVASAFRRQPRGHDRNGARSGARIGAPEGPAGATSLPGGPPAARRRASCQGPPPRLSLRWGVGAEGHARLNSMGPRLRPWFVPPCARDLWLELSARHARGGAIPALPIWGQRLCTCSLPPRASHFICASACSDEFQICHRICRRGRATLSAPPRAATNFSPSRKKFQLRRGLRGYTVATVRAETRPAPRAGRAGRACAKKAARPCTTVPCQGHPWALAWCTAGPTRPSSKPKTPSGNAKIRTGSFSRAGGQSSPPQSS